MTKIMTSILITIIICTGIFLLYNHSNNGVYRVNENAVLIKGSCITINWNATNEEAQSALDLWKKVRGHK